jgi:predicted AlkP superfamily phosphohydrolase/phosphomutase
MRADAQDDDQPDPGAMRGAVVGLDGAAWHLLRPLLEEGAMPHLQEVVASGASGTLASTVPPVTPPAWTSAVTGVNPGRHGIYGFHRGHAQYEHQELMHAGAVRTATLWEMLNAQDATAGIFNLPLTYPPQALDGWMVSGFMTPGMGLQLKGFAYPPNLQESILSWEPDYTIEIKANQEQDWRDAALAERALKAIRQRHQVLERILDTHPVDVLFAVLETPDRLQHLYYRYMDPAEPAYNSDAARRVRGAITECFRAMDDIIGLVAGRVDQGRMIVCSDHGFTAWDVSVHTNALLQEWGYLSLKPGTRLMQNPVVARAVPLARRFTPVGLRRRAKKKTLDAIDWSKTRAFAAVYYQEGIFVNVEGRERWGIVPPGELEQVKDELADRFLSLRGPDGGPVTDGVWRSQEVFHGDALEGAPDLVLSMRDHRFVIDDDVFHNRPFTDHRDLPRGGHHPDGIVAVAGSGVAAGGKIDASIVDITPTLLYMSGLKIPEGLDGGIMDRAFEPAHLDGTPPESMPPVDHKREEKSPYTAEEEALIEEELRGLGYL